MTETILGDDAEPTTENTDATLVTEPEKNDENIDDAAKLAAAKLEEEKKAEEAKVDKDSDADTSQRAL